MVRQRSRKRKPPGWAAPAVAFAVVFTGTSYLLTPGAPGKAVLQAEWTKRTTDQHYSGCHQARANRHEDIGAWEPSYRSEMDGDGDGRACEPYRG